MNDPAIAQPSTLAPKTFGLHILAAPQALGTKSAQSFLDAALKLGHRPKLLFFNGAGVLNAQTVLSPSQQSNTSPLAATLHRWLQLANLSQTPLMVCSGSASTYNLNTTQLKAPWQLASLSELLDAYRELDQVITFKD